MQNFYDTQDIPCFGVAGNFTGHLEQAGEAADFKNVKTLEQNAPKAIFPTFLPKKSSNLASDASVIPDFLTIFPFDPKRIIFPKGEEKLQIEPECALLFKACWKDKKIISLEPQYFGASNDCSIRKEGAKKISLKKNWGPSTKGFSENLIPVDSFTAGGILNRYRIASFLKRGDEVYVYGENSAIRDYSYIYEKLNLWLLDKLNNQQDQGPAEDIHSYLTEAGCPENLMISIGATRYTEFGEKNFLQKGDRAVVILYPEEKYTPEQIEELVKKGEYSDREISVLDQEIIL